MNPEDVTYLRRRLEEMKLYCSDCNKEVGEMLKGRIAKNKIVIRCLKCDNNYQETIPYEPNGNFDNGEELFNTLFKGAM